MAVHPVNTLYERTSAGIVTLVTDIQFSNALAPIFLIVSGITISFNDSHPKNTNEGILSIELLKLTDFNDLHSPKEYSPYEIIFDVLID